jgi:hypothetical protein
VYAQGCSRANAAANAVKVQDLVVTAADFHFRSAQRLPAGLTRIRLYNEGSQFHHVQLVRLAAGHTFSEFVERLNAGDFKLSWATFVGGPDTPMPKGVAEATLLLIPGEYAMICIISGADHVPHVAKGMALPLTVTAARARAIVEPDAEVHMSLREYAFDITPAISAGRRTLRVENAGQQPHHVALVRLGPGRSAEDALAWFKQMTGAPLDTPIGGTTALAPGVVNFITADFEAGNYALICFLPDSSDGRSHAQHGMLRQIRVR